MEIVNRMRYPGSVREAYEMVRQNYFNGKYKFTQDDCSDGSFAICAREKINWLSTKWPRKIAAIGVAMNGYTEVTLYSGRANDVFDLK